MKQVFEIVKVVGFGTYECPSEKYSTGLIFNTEEAAELEADKLWKEKTTESDRKSGWCGLHYRVIARELL